MEEIALSRFYDVGADPSATSATRINNRSSSIRSQTEWLADSQLVFLGNIGFFAKCVPVFASKPGGSYDTANEKGKSLACK